MGAQPKVISTFAGCGGSSLGYKMAGYRELLAIDFDENCEKTFSKNFPEIPFWRRDITKVSANEILEFTGLKTKELDLLDGSPPCQGFSMAGRRKVSDPRNDLFLEFIRLINGLQPKVFVMENVPGQVRGIMKGKYNEIMEKLMELDYKVGVKLLNAKHYNVPQSRQRIFYIGIRNDIGKEPCFPIPNNKIVTAGKALRGVKPERYKLLSNLETKYWIKLSPGETGSKINSRGNWFGFRKLNPNMPSPTIIKSAGNGLCHWNEPRHFSYNELAILSSFPQDFKFTGSESDRIDRIGNAVMPKMMEAVARTVRERILDT